MQGNPREQEEQNKQAGIPYSEKTPEKPARPPTDTEGDASGGAHLDSQTIADDRQAGSREEGLPPEAGGRMTSVPEEPPVAGEEQIPEITQFTLPDDKDWDIRPFSPSQRFGAVDTERNFAEEAIQPGLNLPAVAGLIFALFGILPGFWGIFFASLGLAFSVTGIWAAVQRDAGRLAVGILGTGIAIVFLVGHFIRIL